MLPKHEPLSITIAVLGVLLLYPSVSIGLTPSKGGSRRFHIFAGSDFGELRPDCGGVSIAPGMFAVLWRGFEEIGLSSHDFKDAVAFASVMAAWQWWRQLTL